MSRRLGVVVLVAVLISTLALGLSGAHRASADSFPFYFVSATSDCASASFTVVSPAASRNTLNLVSMPSKAGFAFMMVTAVDAEGHYLGDYSYTDFLNMSGTIWYSMVPKKSVTLTLYILGGPISYQHEETQRGGKMARPATIPITWHPVDERVIPVTCGIGPGCDVSMVPAGSVMGLVLRDVSTSWTPGQLTQPLVVLPAGKTAWVVGVDETGEYYKVVWGCSYLWVDVDAMGPNPDNLWKSTPLPQRIVK